MKIEVTEEELKFVFRTAISSLMVMTFGFIVFRTINHLKETQLLEYNRTMVEARIEMKPKRR